MQQVYLLQFYKYISLSNIHKDITIDINLSQNNFDNNFGTLIIKQFWNIDNELIN